MDTPRPPKLPVLARLTAFLPWMCANSEEVLAAPEDPAANRGMADKMLSQVRGLSASASCCCDLAAHRVVDIFSTWSRLQAQSKEQVLRVAP